MPNPNETDPRQSRERGLFETDEQYRERMKWLDFRDEIFGKISTHAPGQEDTP